MFDLLTIVTNYILMFLMWCTVFFAISLILSRDSCLPSGADPDIRMRGAKLVGSRAIQTNRSGAEGEAYSSRVQGKAPGPKKLEFYVV